MILQVPSGRDLLFQFGSTFVFMFLVEGVNLFEPRHGSYDLNVNFHKEKIEDLFAGPRELLNQDNQNE